MWHNQWNSEVITLMVRHLPVSDTTVALEIAIVQLHQPHGGKPQMTATSKAPL